MLTYVLGLISPEALTTDDKSWRCAFPVCTVDTFLPLWWTVMPTMMANTTTTPTPIAIFFQGFMISVTIRSYRDLEPTAAPFASSCSRDFRRSAGVTGTHSE